MNQNIKRLSVALVVALMLSTVIGIQFVAETFAKTTTVTYGPGYKQIVGELDNASFLVRFPDPITNWNGKLVVFCRGYSHPIPALGAPPAWLVNTLIPLGYAFAMSTYGEGGYCIQKGVIRTHQMTEYIVDNYHVTGKIYLVGISMGGNIVLQLGAKYPHLYAGVLDLCGSKDLADQYTTKIGLAATTTDAELIAMIGVLVAPDPPPVPPYPFSAVPVPSHCLHHFLPQQHTDWTCSGILAELRRRTLQSSVAVLLSRNQKPMREYPHHSALSILLYL